MKQRQGRFYAIKHYNLGEINDGSPIPSTTRAAVYVRDLSIHLGLHLKQHCSETP